MEPRQTRTLLSAALALSLVGGGACADTKYDKVATDAGAGASSTAAPKAAGGQPLAITGTDYEFKGVPKTAAAGTVVTFKNTSAKEVHEVVALRVKDGETRPMSDLLALPETEAEKVAEFRGVIVALPGEEGFAPTGPLTLSQPGRYMLLCAIPTGADPAAYKAALEAKKGPGPVEVPGGPPHLTKGMAAELTVT